MPGTSVQWVHARLPDQLRVLLLRGRGLGDLCVPVTENQFKLSDFKQTEETLSEFTKKLNVLQAML